ncbi:MAG: hypothetical protein V7K55_01905 [Nostoc sp.]
MKQHLVEKQVREDKDFVSSMGEKCGQAAIEKLPSQPRNFSVLA